MQKKILFAAYAFLPEFGGLEQQIYILAKHYQKIGYQVDVLTEKSATNQSALEVLDGIRVYRVPYSKDRSVFSYLALILHLSSYILAHGREYEVIHLRAALTLYPLLFSFWKWLGAIKVPLYVTADTGGENDEIIAVKKWPFHSLMIFFFNQITWMNSICEANYSHYQQLGFPKKKLTKIGNGIDISYFKNAKYPKKVTNFLFLGRIIKEKGVYELLYAFALLLKKFPEAKLHLAGDGKEKGALLNIIKDRDLIGSVLYHGVISGQDKEKLFSRIDCLVLPSYSEGFSLVCAEAAAHKKIIIATNVADLKKNFGSNIFFCKKRNVIDLYKSMALVCQKKDFTFVNYDFIIKQFDIDKTFNQLYALHRQ
jgi:glycosyltransferase involved in cell wall biosynthesis